MSNTPLARKPYPGDVGDEEWAFVAPYLALAAARPAALGPRLPADAPLAGRRRLRGPRRRPAPAAARGRRAGRNGQPSAAILDRRTLQSTPESGARAGYDGHQRRTGAKVRAAVDTLGHLLALLVTPADEQDRAQVAAQAAAHGGGLEVVKRPGAKRGFVLLPRRWVVARDLARAARFRRLTRDDEPLPQVLAGLHFIAFACLMLHRLIPVLLVHNTL